MENVKEREEKLEAIKEIQKIINLTVYDKLTDGINPFGSRKPRPTYDEIRKAVFAKLEEGSFIFGGDAKIAVERAIRLAMNSAIPSLV